MKGAILKQFILYTSTLISFSLIAQVPPKVELPSLDSNRLLFEKASKLRYSNPDSALLLLDICYDKLLELQDTLNAAYILKEQARIYGHQAQYKGSYDKLWKALIMADEAGIEKMKAIIYTDIGYYYSYYKRKEKAIEYFDLSLKINKDLVKRGLLDKAFLADNYYAYSSTFRGLNEPSSALPYLDSCMMYHRPGLSDVNIAYINLEKAFHLKEENKYSEAIKVFQDLLPWIEKNDPGYQVLVYTYMGDIYIDLGDYKQSEICYQTAVQHASNYQSHLDFSPLIHERLSDLYFKKGEIDLAFKKLKTVKELDEQFFDSRSVNNRPLLEIQDAFRIEKEQQKKILQEQRLAQLEQEEKVLFLQRLILLISLGFILLIGILYVKYLRNKHKAEKKLIRKKQELEIQKANEIVELKNKELSTSTLKLIEKDRLIQNLQSKFNVRGDVNLREIKHIINMMSAENGRNWEEFEARFISVNKGFYERLKKRFPKLTQGDLKICALIKLNFSSKDMSRLLGISVESVHTTRYRLRKKLLLSRENNLTEFIAAV